MSEEAKARRKAAQKVAMATPEYRAKNHEHLRRVHEAARIDGPWFGRLRRVYGLSSDQYKEMVEAQGGMCPICEIRQAICVDHDHETDQTRALLCRRCNAALGLFDDDRVIVARAARYLEKHAEVRSVGA